MLILKILGGVAALALGLWLGLPGRYERRDDEISRAIDTPGGRSQKAKRHFTPLAWVRRQVDVRTGGGRSRGGGRGFRLERPDDDRRGDGGAFRLERPGKKGEGLEDRSASQEGR